MVAREDNGNSRRIKPVTSDNSAAELQGTSVTSWWAATYVYVRADAAYTLLVFSSGDWLSKRDRHSFGLQAVYAVREEISTSY